MSRPLAPPCRAAGSTAIRTDQHCSQATARAFADRCCDRGRTRHERAVRRHHDETSGLTRTRSMTGRSALLRRPRGAARPQPPTPPDRTASHRCTRALGVVAPPRRPLCSAHVLLPFASARALWCRRAVVELVDILRGEPHAPPRPPHPRRRPASPIALARRDLPARPASPSSTAAAGEHAAHVWAGASRSGWLAARRSRALLSSSR